ncbi:hypothetical protein ACGFWI_09105 [Streptomyces sp. NPDC048434]|uniref:hypothetical protein n=1 Tax=Streptomyces sp. NPDC048434 TaxID=3365549 RepID=UPI0037128C86
MTDDTDVPGTTEPEVRLSSEPGGRQLTPGTAMLATTVGVISIVVGALLAAVSLTGRTFGAWKSSTRTHG